MHILQTEETKTGEVSPHWVRAFVRAMINKQFGINIDTDGVTLEAVIPSGMTSHGIHYCNQDGQVVAVHYVLDILL